MKKRIVFLISVVAIMMFACCTLTSCSGTPSQEIVSKYESLKPGDKVALGNYNNEELQWIVASNTGDKMLLISQKAIESKEYASGEDTCTWDAAPIREWLNNEFIEAAFSSEEKTVILDTEVVQDKNPEYDVELGESTVDKLFLLSIKEANKYLPTKKYRKCSASDYVKANSKNVNDGVISWWLRTPGEKKGATYVFDDGVVNSIGTMPNFELGVRPAMWVSLGKDAEPKEEVKIMAVEPLTIDDMLVSGDCVDDKEYVINALKESGEGGFRSFYYDHTTDKSKKGVVKTNRGIRLGDSKNKVIEKYGEGISGDFDSEHDFIVEYAKNSVINDGEVVHDMTEAMKAVCYSYIRYTIKDKYIISFYFDEENTVSWIYYTYK